MAKETFAGSANEDKTVKADKKAEITKQESQLPSTRIQRGNAVAFEDLAWSRINVMNSSSKYDVAGAHDGDIILEQQLKVADAGAKVPLIVLAKLKRLKENIPYGSQQVPRIFNSIEEADGEDLDYELIPFADVAGLLEWDPEGPVSESDADAAFPFEVGERRYALVQYTVQKSRAVEENYAKIATMELAKGDLTKFYVHLYTRQKAAMGNTWWQFMVAPTGIEVPGETREFIDRLSSL